MHPLAPLAEILERSAYDFVGLAGAAIMSLAGWLQWRLTSLCSEVEEEEKDAKITAGQARNRLRVLRLMGPLLMLVGMGLLLFAAVKWCQGWPG